MDTRTIKKVVKRMSRPLAVVLIAFFVVAPAVYSYTQYSPGALLQVGDVTSSHIRNATIVDADVSATAAIAGGKVAPYGLTGAVLMSDGTNIATSTTMKYATSTADFYVLGGTIHASSTNFGGVAYTWATSDGTNGQALTTNGAGALSWSTPNVSYITSSLTAGEALAAGQAVFVATSTNPTVNYASQTTESNDDNIGTAATSDQIGQIFVESQATCVSSAIVKLRKAGSPTDNIIMEIQGTTSSLPNGYTYGTSTRAASGFAAVAQEEQFSFSPCVALTPSTTYAITMRRSGAYDATNYIIWRYKLTGSPYANGDKVVYASGAWSTATGDDTYFSLNKKFSAGAAYLADGSTYHETLNFIGFATAATTASSTATIAVAGVSTQSGLTPVVDYYLSNTPGAISSTAGTVSKRACHSVSATDCVLVSF